MSREIKFRAWDKKAGKYRELGVYDVSNEKIVVRFPIETLRKGEFVLEQYTGLKDKNGKEIYEGDIVKARYYDKYESKKWYAVCGRVHIEPRATYIDDSPDGEWETWVALCEGFEVIGNIHENPELLGKEKNG